MDIHTSSIWGHKHLNVNKTKNWITTTFNSIRITQVATNIQDLLKYLYSMWPILMWKKKGSHAVCDCTATKFQGNHTTCDNFLQNCRFVSTHKRLRVNPITHVANRHNHNNNKNNIIEVPYLPSSRLFPRLSLSNLCLLYSGSSPLSLLRLPSRW